MSARPDPNFIPDVIYAVHRTCTSRWRLIERRIEGWNLTYVIGGRSTYVVEGKEVPVGIGDLLCMAPGTLRSAETSADNPMRCLSADFLLKKAEGEASAPPLPLLSGIGIDQDLTRLYHELAFAWAEKAPGCAVRARGLLLLILHRVIELTEIGVDAAIADPRIERAARYITAHYPEALNVRSMASMLGLSPTYAGQLFKRSTGLTFNQYLARTRIRFAESMLRSGEYGVAEAAESCGFHDPFHFDKRFKEITGHSPSQCIPAGSRPRDA